MVYRIYRCLLCDDEMQRAIPQICDRCMCSDDGCETDINSITDFEDWGYET